MDKNKFYVVTEKDISDLKYDEIYDKLDQKSQLYLNSEPNDIRLRVLHSFQDCESPIERILSWEMDRFGLCNFGYFNTSIYQVDIFHQLPIYLKQKKTAEFKTS